MARTAEGLRAHRGPALFAGGFRPFFLAGAAWAVVAMILWLPTFEGEITLPIALGPVDWHVHELLFGWVGAAVAGFLLTAVPNWTGRLPVVGRPLAALVALWLAGRVAILASGLLGGLAAAIVDLAFPLAFAALAGREVIAGRNWRNLKILALVCLFALADAVFLYEALARGGADLGLRLGIAVVLMLVVVVGGRIVPSFTANWLRPRGPGAMPAPFAPFDQIESIVVGAALALWVVLPETRIAAAALLVAGLAEAARLARWAGWRTWAEKLVFVLHLSRLFVPVGFLLLAANQFGLPVPRSAALHAWTIGAFGLTILAVSTRASLGHTGRPLHATRPIAVLYAAAFVAVLARVAMGLGVAPFVSLHVAALGWILAFGGFVWIYGPILTRPR